MVRQTTREREVREDREREGESERERERVSERASERASESESESEREGGGGGKRARARETSIKNLVSVRNCCVAIVSLLQRGPTHPVLFPPRPPPTAYLSLLFIRRRS